MKNSILAKYHTQKNGAKRRNIEWQFTFKTWTKWWQDHLGKDWVKKRGNKPNQYQMARWMDTSPYAPWNVDCLTVRDHIKDRGNNGVEWRSGDPNGPVVRQLDKIEELLLAGNTVHATATKLGISSTQIYKRYPKGVLTVMKKRGIPEIKVRRWRKIRTIKL